MLDTQFCAGNQTVTIAVNMIVFVFFQTSLHLLNLRFRFCLCHCRCWLLLLLSRRKLPQNGRPFAFRQRKGLLRVGEDVFQLQIGHDLVKHGVDGLTLRTLRVGTNDLRLTARAADQRDCALGIGGLYSGQRAAPAMTCKALVSFFMGRSS